MPRRAGVGMRALRAFWRGDLPLAEAFWIWTVMIGLALNLLTTIALLTLISFDRPWLAVVAGYSVSVPYNIMAVIGTWRSADRYRGRDVYADLGRGASVMLMAVLSLI